MSIPTPIYSARDTAITQRPTSTAILAIDSEDRYKEYETARDPTLATNDNRSPYDFVIRKNESIMNGFFTRLGITEVAFPWVVPNINVKTKRMLVRYQIGAVVSDYELIELEESFATPAQIASAIQVLVRALDPALNAFTMTYGGGLFQPANFPCFEYNTGSPGVLIAFEPMDYNSDDYPYPPTTKQLFDILGFFGRGPGLTILDPPATGNRLLRAGFAGTSTYCQAIRYIDIVCSQLVYNQALKDTMSQEVSRDILCRLYLSGAPGQTSTVSPSSPTFCPPGCMPTTIYREFSAPKQIQWIPNQPVPGYLRFEVYDDTGAPLSESYPFSANYPALNNINWSMTMLVTEN